MEVKEQGSMADDSIQEFTGYRQLVRRVCKTMTTSMNYCRMFTFLRGKKIPGISCIIALFRKYASVGLVPRVLSKSPSPVLVIRYTLT